MGAHGMVLGLKHVFALEGAIGSHACWLEASMRVTNSILLGRPLHLIAAAMNCVKTLKVSDPNQTPLRVQAMKKETGQQTEMVLNEYIPFIGDWCDLDSVPRRPNTSAPTRCPNWQNPATAGGDPDLSHGTAFSPPWQPAVP
jgi:hypothetical protein